MYLHDSYHRTLFTTQFTCFTGTEVQILTLFSCRGVCLAHPSPQASSCASTRYSDYLLYWYSVYVLYWYTSTNADVTQAAPPPGTQFTCFTGTEVHILTSSGASTWDYSGVLLYWYRSTHTDHTVGRPGASVRVNVDGACGRSASR